MLFHRRTKHSKQRPSALKRLLRYLLIVLALVVIADALYLAAIWPDWEKLATGPVPKSNFIRRYEAQRDKNPQLPPLRWQPVTLQRIAPIMGKAAIAAEDSRFYEHEGIDTEAIQEAMERNIARGKVVAGASTISQQTVKNMFLSGSRDYLRKWHELLLTWSMERNLRKPRILEIYLNVAEFGPGIYGVEAASRYYWGIPASALTYEQSIQLAACLPSPKKHNPKTSTRTFWRRVATITRHLKSPAQPRIEPEMEQAAEPTDSMPVEPVLVEPLPMETDAPLEMTPPLEGPPIEPAPTDAAPAPEAGDPVREMPTTTPP